MIVIIKYCDLVLEKQPNTYKKYKLHACSQARPTGTDIFRASSILVSPPPCTSSPALDAAQHRGRTVRARRGLVAHRGPGLASDMNMATKAANGGIATTIIEKVLIPIMLQGS